MEYPIISLVVAVAENGVIGREGQLPWRMPSDLKVFRRLTMAKPIIMGRRTFDSIGKALDGRDNIVVTRDAEFIAPGAIVATSLTEALAIAKRAAQLRGAHEVMVIGGAEIFALALPLADRVYLTRIHATPTGDIVFPALDAAHWSETKREPISPDPRDDHQATLTIYERVGRTVGL